jgi:hypothetical protein
MAKSTNLYTNKELLKGEKQYMRQQQAYARYHQKQQQNKIVSDYNASVQKAKDDYITEYNRLQREFNQSRGNPALQAEINQALTDAKQKRDSTIDKAKSDKSAALIATADLNQFGEGFTPDKWEQVQKAESVRTEQTKKETNNDTSDSSSSSNTNVKDTSVEDTGNYSGLGRYIGNKFFGDTTNPTAAHLERQAEIHDKQAGDEQKNTQQNFQIANRNYRVEAEKNAASQAASENAQKVNNMGNVSAGAAALERGIKSADYNTHMQRSDQQRAQGVENQRAMHDARQIAEHERSRADYEKELQRQTTEYNNNANYLSRGGTPDNGASSVTSNNSSDKKQTESVNKSEGQPAESKEQTDGTTATQTNAQAVWNAYAKLVNPQGAIAVGENPELTHNWDNAADRQNYLHGADEDATISIASKLNDGQPVTIGDKTYNSPKELYLSLHPDEGTVESNEIALKNTTVSDARMKNILAGVQELGQ